MRIACHVPPVRSALLVMLGAGVLVGCGTTDEREDVPAEFVLRPVETFRWGGQPIEFALPPDGWRREITNQGGLLGASFIKSGSVGEVIQISEYMQLEKRDRCEALHELIDDFDDMDTHGFRSAVHKARLYASPPLNEQEEQVVVQANETLDRAFQAFARGDRPEAFRELEIGARQATRIRYSLDDVVERVYYSGKGFPPYVKADVGEPERTEFQGEPAVRQSYTLVESKRHYEGRRLYFMRNNRLFVAGFQGLAENVPLFDQVVATIRFPRGECEH